MPQASYGSKAFIDNHAHARHGARRLQSSLGTIARIHALPIKGPFMEGPARGCLAGLISWKLGGGIVSTLAIFLLAYWLLGHC